MYEHMRGLECRYLEADELWTFCRKKEVRLTPAEKLNPELGDQYLFFCIDHETKVVPAWALGKRNSATMLQFLVRLNGALNGQRPQISTDGWQGYVDTIDQVFGLDVDHAVLVKEYESVAIGPGRYAPPRVSGVKKWAEIGHPDERYICTSIVERHNLTVRTMQRRFSRLVLGFSRKVENLQAACALHWAYYNFVWQPRTLGGVSPAMAAGATDRLWDVAELVGDC